MKKILILISLVTGVVSFSANSFDVKVLANSGYNYREKTVVSGVEAIYYPKPTMLIKSVYLKTGIGIRGEFDYSPTYRKVSSGSVLVVGSVITGSEVSKDFDIYGGVNLESGPKIYEALKDREVIENRNSVIVNETKTVKVDLTIRAKGVFGLSYKGATLELRAGYPSVNVSLGYTF